MLTKGYRKRTPKTCIVFEGKCRTSEIKDHQQAKQQEAENQEVQEKMEHLETRLFERLHEIETGIREKKEVQEIKGLLEEVHQLVEQLSSLSAGSCQSIGGKLKLVTTWYFITVVQKLHKTFNQSD